MTELILVNVHGGEADAGQPFLYADDLAAVRGDGIFETMLVRDGKACAVDRHLDRLARSAAIVQLPPPDRDAFVQAIDNAVSLWVTKKGRSVEGLLRVVYSRGREEDPATEAKPDNTTAYVTVGPVPARAAAARTKGIDVLTLDRGYSIDLAGNAPWALLGAKTLSYASNMAAVRHAIAAGYDDVIYLSSEGVVLEGPRSTVIAVTGKTLVTPPVESGILPGTTAQALFDLAEQEGWQTKSETLFTGNLIAADSVWLVSSVTLAARVRRINDFTLVDEDASTSDDGDRISDSTFSAMVDRAVAI